MVDLSKFTSSKKILSKVAVLYYNQFYNKTLSERVGGWGGCCGDFEGTRSTWLVQWFHQEKGKGHKKTKGTSDLN